MDNDYNTGYYNTGYYNTGNRNTGYYNTGNRNTGDYNTGNRNTGYYNTGNRNTGYYNTGDCNTGFFCVDTPSPVFFDRPWGGTWEEAYELIPAIDLPVGCKWVPLEQMSDAEKSENPNHTTIGGYLKILHKTLREAFPIAWEKLDNETRQRFLDLPNFDAEKFEQITGVDVREESPANEPAAEIILNGVRYRRVDE